MKWNVAGRQQILIVLIKPVIINWGGRTPHMMVSERATVRLKIPVRFLFPPKL